MRLVIISEQRVYGCHDSGWYCEASGGGGYEFWSRYLRRFENVQVCCRARRSSEPGRGVRVDGKHVVVSPITYYRGMSSMLRALPWVCRDLFSIGREGATAYLLRAPGTLASLMSIRLRLNGTPYGVEVIGDPHDALAPAAGVRVPARRIVRALAVHLLRKQCLRAGVVAYVTRKVLQRRYPARSPERMWHCSDVSLPPESFAPAPHRFPVPLRTPNFICVGSMDQMYKGFDVQIAALKKVLEAGLEAHVTFLGDGVYRSYIQRLSENAGVSQHTHFKGNIADRSAVLRLLDEADIFVMPSRTEGMPKALLEAMARGLPAITSAVGGMPELIDENMTVKPGCADSLSRKMLLACSDTEMLERCSERNLRTAFSFRDEVTSVQLDDFLMGLRSLGRRVD